MKIKYKGEKMYEFYPEDEVEVPKKVRVCRLKGVGPGTIFDWIVYGLHPASHSTITLFKYFPSMEEAHNFVSNMSDWEQVLRDEGLIP